MQSEQDGMELGGLYLRVLESFVATFGMIAAFFVRRIWLLPTIPIALLVVFISCRARRAPPAPDAETLRVAQRRGGP